jgi:hypothetical protein
MAQILHAALNHPPRDSGIPPSVKPEKPLVLCPIEHSDGHDPPRLSDKLVPSIAAVVDDLIIGVEDPVRKPVIAHELPDVFLRIQLRALCRQRDQRDVRGNIRSARQTPSGLIEKKDGVCARGGLRGDLGEMQVHRLGDTTRQDERGAFVLLRTDRAEDIGRGGSLIAGGAWARAALGPTTGDLVLLADPRLVGEPDLYRAGIDSFFASDCFQARVETFLKSSIAPSAWA